MRMQKKFATLLAAFAVAGGVAGFSPSVAAASAPIVNGPCTSAEASTTRTAPDGTRVVCVYLNSGSYRWMRVASPKPVV